MSQQKFLVITVGHTFHARARGDRTEDCECGSKQPTNQI